MNNPSSQAQKTVLKIKNCPILPHWDGRLKCDCEDVLKDALQAAESLGMVRAAEIAKSHSRCTHYVGGIKKPCDCIHNGNAIEIEKDILQEAKKGSRE